MLLLKFGYLSFYKYVCQGHGYPILRYSLKIFPNKNCSTYMQNNFLFHEHLSIHTEHDALRGRK